MSGKYKQSGFTIVELLIVIVVIAILAAISVVAYNGIQQRATKTTLQNDLSNFSKNIEIVRIDSTDGKYPSTLTAAMGFRLSKNAYMIDRYNAYYCLNSDRSKYAFGVVSSHGDQYVLTPTEGITTHPSVYGDSTCVAAGATTGSNAGHTYLNNVNSWQPWTN